jgi:hypothetical protein
MIKTIISAESPMSNLFHQNVASRYTVQYYQTYFISCKKVIVLGLGQTLNKLQLSSCSLIFYGSSGCKFYLKTRTRHKKASLDLVSKSPVDLTQKVAPAKAHDSTGSGSAKPSGAKYLV